MTHYTVAAGGAKAESEIGGATVGSAPPRASADDLDLWGRSLDGLAPAAVPAWVAKRTPPGHVAVGAGHGQLGGAEEVNLADATGAAHGNRSYDRPR